MLTQDIRKNRLRCVQSLGLLDDAWLGKLDHVARLSASLTDSDMAAVCVVAGNTIKVIAQVGMGVQTLQLHSEIFDHAIGQTAPFEVADILNDERFAQSGTVEDEFDESIAGAEAEGDAPIRLRSFASAPVTIADLPVGIILIADRRVRELSSRQADALTDLALLVADKLSGTPLNGVTTALTVGERTTRELARVAAPGSGVEQLLSLATHQLRLPLMHILREAQLMSNDKISPLRPLQRQRLAGLESTGHQMLELIDRLFELSRLQAVPAENWTGRSDVHEIISNVVHEVAMLADAHGVKVEHERPELDLMGAIDSPALSRVMNVLLSNAVVYNTAGGQVSITVHRMGAQIAIRVSDTGRGLSRTEIDQLFQPFHRLGAQDSSVTHHHGCGLGLIIAQTIVRSCGGDIMVQSETGIGSVFEVRLPAVV